VVDRAVVKAEESLEEQDEVAVQMHQKDEEPALWGLDLKLCGLQTVL
jgi:hypothetical protein